MGSNWGWGFCFVLGGLASLSVPLVFSLFFSSCFDILPQGLAPISFRPCVSHRCWFFESAVLTLYPSTTCQRVHLSPMLAMLSMFQVDLKQNLGTYHFSGQILFVLVSPAW